MRINTAIRLIMEVKHVTQTEMAKELGLSSQGVIWKRLSSPNMTIGNVLEMLDTLGYKLTVKEKDCEELTENEITITAEDFVEQL